MKSLKIPKNQKKIPDRGNPPCEEYFGHSLMFSQSGAASADRVNPATKVWVNTDSHVSLPRHALIRGNKAGKVFDPITGTGGRIWTCLRKGFVTDQSDWKRSHENRSEFFARSVLMVDERLSRTR